MSCGLITTCSSHRASGGVSALPRDARVPLGLRSSPSAPSIASRSLLVVSWPSDQSPFSPVPQAFSGLSRCFCPECPPAPPRTLPPTSQPARPKALFQQRAVASVPADARHSRNALWAHPPTTCHLDELPANLRHNPGAALP